MSHVPPSVVLPVAVASAKGSALSAHIAGIESLCDSKALIRSQTKEM